MPLVAAAACNEDLSVRITSPLLGIDVALVYTHITGFTTTARSSSNNHPIPAQTDITDHMIHDPAIISINGNIGCVGCTQASANTVNVAAILEEARRIPVYNPDDYFTIVTNRVNRYSKMKLVDYSVIARDDELQSLTVSTTWEASNIAGNLESPSFELGGIFR